MVDANRRRLTVGVRDSTQIDEESSGVGALAKALADMGLNGLSIVHSTTDAKLNRKPSYAEKDRVGSFEDPVLQGVKCVCKKGLKPEAPNQDSYVIVVDPGKWGLYGILDGHGPNGHHVSDFSLHKVVKLFLGYSGFDTETGDAFNVALTGCQKALVDENKPEWYNSSGSTCTMAFHNMATDILTTAHVGDCRAVLYMGSQIPLQVLKETEDHKPDLPDEEARITKNGGRVVFDGYYNYRVFSKKGMYPGLNMSRALGDIVGHVEAGLTAEPELNIVNLKDEREKPGAGPLNLVIASDGCWEFIKSEEAPSHLADIADKKTIKNETAAVERLAKKSYDLWKEDSGNEISDDITVMQVTL